jgi:hypothetical protein
METTLTQSRIDELGELLAQIDTLTKKADKIKDDLKEEASLSGQRQFDGALFRATYTESNRSTVNWQAIVKKLAIPEQVIIDNTKTTAVYSVRVTSK